MKRYCGWSLFALGLLLSSLQENLWAVELHPSDRNLIAVAATTNWLAQWFDQYHTAYYVYSDADSAGNHFPVLGQMGDCANTAMNVSWTNLAYSGTSCVKAYCPTHEGMWGGYYFMNGVLLSGETTPRANWGAYSNAGVSLAGATCLRFRVKGLVGGERVEFFVGGVGWSNETGKAMAKYPDSLRKTSTGYVTLGTGWKEYTISLSGTNLTAVLGGFGWAASAAQNSSKDITFFIDDVRFDKSRLSEPHFMLSFQTLQGTNLFDTTMRNVAYTYDNAVAAIAFLACGDTNRAAKIDDAFVYALRHDRYYSDGRLRSAYQAGDLSTAPGWFSNGRTNTARISGWMNAASNSWLEDRTQVGITAGNQAWAMLALLNGYAAIGNTNYLAAARIMGEWIESHCRSDEGPGGYTAGTEGWEPSPTNLTYKSTEHAIDLYAAFSWLHRLTPGDTVWSNRAEHARQFIEAMYDSANRRFWTGTKEDGTTVNTDVYALDCQVWPLLAFGDSGGAFTAAVTYAEAHMRAGAGFAFSEGNTNGAWMEGSAFAAETYNALGRTNDQRSVVDFLAASRDSSGGLFATDAEYLRTGIDLSDGSPWVYYHRLHAAPTAWFLLAVASKNPYTGVAGIQLPESYSVAFNPGAGTVFPTTAIVTNALKYGALPVPTRQGYAFGGWWTGTDGGGTRVTNATPVARFSDQTLYAKWLANQAPTWSVRSPVAVDVRVREGTSVAFSVTTSDVTDPTSDTRGMSNVTWYVDGALKQETRTGAPGAIASTFTFKTDSATVTGVASRAFEVRVVAMDRWGASLEANWTVCVSNVPLSQSITFAALPVKGLGDADISPGAKASSGLPVAYSSSNESVATVSNGVIQIVGAGATVITASQAGNCDFKAASVSQALTVKVRLTALTPSGGGAVTGQGLYAPSAKAALAAWPSAGNTFLRWEDGSQAASRSLTMPGSNVTVSAWFGFTTNVPPPAVVSPGSQQAMVGVYYALPLDVRSESLPTVTVTGLPAGLAYEVSTRTIKGVPTAAVSNKVVTVMAKNVNKVTGTNAFMLTVSPLSARAQGTFTGAASDGGTGDNDSVVKGLLNATVTAQGAFTAKVTAQSGTVSFTGTSWDSASNGVFLATLKTAKGETLTLAQDALKARNVVGLTGALTGGTFTSGLEILGQRNPAATKTASDYAAGTNALARFKGYYTVALPPEAELESPGAAGNVPLGSGWLALTVKDGGAVALAGKLADGTALSGASTLVVIAEAEAGEAAYVPFLFPLYGAKGVFSGVLEILQAASAPTGNVALADDSFIQAWAYPGKAPAASPAQTEDRFTLSLGMSGGWYNTLADLRAYYSNAWFSAAAASVSNTYASGAYTTVVGFVASELPEEALRFDAKTGAVSLPAGKAPVYDDVTSNYVYTATNSAVATLTVVKTTGLFSGTFNLYYEYFDQKGALQLKTVSVSPGGALTPVRAEPEVEPSGSGFYLVPNTWKSLDAKPVAYPLKRSYGVEIRDGE